MGQYCSSCGKPLPEGARVCPACGCAVAGGYAGSIPVPPPTPRLVRPRIGRKIAGVCQGISNLYGWDVTVVRIMFVVLSFFSLIGLIAYVVLWVITPEEPYALPAVTGYPPAAPPAT
jgi:phage shock protein C